MSSREVVLRRVRAALGRSGPEGTVAPSRLPTHPDVRRSGDLSPEAIVDLFAERATEYRVTVIRVDEADLPAAIGASLSERSVGRVVAPADLPEAWRVDGVRWLLDGPGDGSSSALDGSSSALDTAAIDGCDAVVTGCALAIAETGTIVLDGGARQGRRVLTLLPDLYVCVVFERQVVQTVPEGVAGTAGAVRAGAPITLVSGPSATSDIELERVEGVHGPRTLVVLLAR